MFSVIVQVTVSLMLVQNRSEGSESGLFSSLVLLMPVIRKGKRLRKRFTTMVRKGIIMQKSVEIECRLKGETDNCPGTRTVGTRAVSMISSTLKTCQCG